MATCFDYDYHPHEDNCRLFVTPQEGLLRLDDETLVSEVRWDSDHLLRHYAFSDRWIKVNVSRGNDGSIFDFNCDLATPMVRDGDAAYAVDLFIDVLVDASATSWRVKDEEDFEAAIANGWLSPAEARAARAELARFVDEVSRGQLVPWLETVCAFDAPGERPLSDMRRVPVPSQLVAPRRLDSAKE